MAEEVITVRLRLERQTPERHVGIAEQLAAFPVIANTAGADQVLPGVLTAAMAGHDVVQREVTRLQTAVLARVVIADEDFAAGQPYSWARPLDQVHQTDY